MRPARPWSDRLGARVADRRDPGVIAAELGVGVG